MKQKCFAELRTCYRIKQLLRAISDSPFVPLVTTEYRRKNSSSPIIFTQLLQLIRVRTRERLALKSGKSMMTQFPQVYNKERVRLFLTFKSFNPKNGQFPSQYFPFLFICNINDVLDVMIEGDCNFKFQTNIKVAERFRFTRREKEVSIFLFFFIFLFLSYFFF